MPGPRFVQIGPRAARPSFRPRWRKRPATALTEAYRALKPDGRILIIDMMPHQREEYRQQMGHLWLGFSRDELESWTRTAGFRRPRYRPLPVDPEAKGPALFVASAIRKS